MSQLTANTQLTYEMGLQNNLPVLTAIIIYMGSAVGLSAGYARQLVAGDQFVGFAEQKIDNTSGASGDVAVPLRKSGLVQLAISGVAVTDVGADVYASDGATFTLTATSNSYVGKVVRYVSSGIAMVAFDVTKS